MVATPDGEGASCPGKNPPTDAEDEFVLDMPFYRTGAAPDGAAEMLLRNRQSISGAAGERRIVRSPDI